jgi:uncharacterized protein
MPSYTLSDLIIYPVKSLTGIHLTRCQVIETGFQYDRKWMLIDSLGQFLSQRRLPKMALIKTALTAEQLILSAPNQQDLLLPPMAILLLVPSGMINARRVVFHEKPIIGSAIF